MARPRLYKIELTDDELKKLKSIIRKAKTSKTIRCRCQIMIDLDEAHGKALHMNNPQNQMVYVWQQLPIP